MTNHRQNTVNSNERLPSAVRTSSGAAFRRAAGFLLACGVVLGGAVSASANVVLPVAQPGRAPIVWDPPAHQNPELVRRGARRSRELRMWNGVRRMLSFPSQVQHVVVIDMENRTLDDLFAGYYNHAWRGGSQVWQNVMNIANPNGSPRLVPNPLATDAAHSFDPNHEHDQGFLAETLQGFDSESFACNDGCASNVTAYSYVPAAGVAPYAQLMQNFSSADEMFQANQGPSMPSHQYLIAGQSGGLPGSLTSPLAIASNPGTGSSSSKVKYYREGADPDGDNKTPYCAGGSKQPSAPSLDMINGRQPAFTTSYPVIQPVCESYTNGTVLDLMANKYGQPDLDDWQYIGHTVGGYWSAPTAVSNLYAQYSQGNPATQPFAIDANAYNFVQNLNGTGNPQRPFAALTYITPCGNTSDHPSASGAPDSGPKWVGALVNDIATAQGGAYWPSTVILITWDDWGGFYDHASFTESALNPYGNPADPNEWGFRVPFIVVSPYVTSAGYVSHGPGGSLQFPVARSQSAILTFIEEVYDLPSLGADDQANDNLLDMFDFSNQLPYTPVTGLGGYKIPKSC